MSTPINPAGASSDPLLGTEQPSSQSTRRRAESERAEHGNDAAEVTISRQAATVSETLQLGQSENADAVVVADSDEASQLAKALAQQITEQPAAARDAQAHANPKVALNLLI